MALSVLGSRFAGRINVPVALLFLGIGMAAGSEGLGGIDFEDYRLSFRLGTVVLVLILFDGGLSAPLRHHQARLRAGGGARHRRRRRHHRDRRRRRAPARLRLAEALLLGAVVCSTDAAAVFSVLRGSRIELGRRVAATLELESGLNDPVAVILTVALTAAAGRPRHLRLAPRRRDRARARRRLRRRSRRRLRRPLAAGARAARRRAAFCPCSPSRSRFVAFGATTLAHG